MRTPKSYFLYIQREQSIMYSLQKRILIFLTIFTCPQFVYIYIMLGIEIASPFLSHYHMNINPEGTSLIWT